MTELKHQPCKREYAELFKRRRIEKECQKVYCYGILDMETDDVITECKFCDEWELNAIDMEQKEE